MKKIEHIFFLSILIFCSFSCSGTMEPEVKKEKEPSEIQGESGNNENETEKSTDDNDIGENSGGEEGEGELPVISPCIAIEYIDKDNNCLINSLEIDRRFVPIVVRDKGIFEILSITDEKDNIFLSDKVFTGKGEHTALVFDIPEGFSPGSNIVRQYTVKYKIPPILGDDKVEVLSLTFNTDEPDRFTNVVYNNKSLSLLAPINFSENQDDTDWNAMKRERDKMLYCGDTIASIEGQSVHLIIPVDK